MGYYLGIDVGTGESKAALIDAECNVVFTASVAHETQNPHPGWFEHDAEEVWWGDVKKLCQRVFDESGIAASHIGCVGISALGCDCVPVDEKCHALAPAILYGVDSRATAEIDQLNECYGERAAEVFGHPICTSDIAPKVLWFKNNMPEIWERAHKFLTASSYLCAKLTGVYTIDSYLAEDFLPLYNIATGQVNPEGCEGICSPSQMAAIAAATDVAGTITAEAAAQTGLAEGTKVLVGTGDSGAEAVSTGVFQPGDIMVQMGSTCYFVYLCDHLVSEPRLWPGTFIIPQTYSICAGTNTAGALTKWLRDELYADALAAEKSGGENAFAVMAREAAEVTPGAEGLVFLPYFAGERTPLNDPRARGTLIGLTTNHTRAHIVRAALEGISCTIAQHFMILDEDELPVQKVMCVGGGTKNEVWLQCVANMLERPVCTSKVTLGAAYGDALMAALAGGAYGSWAELAEHVKPERIIEPDPATFPAYRRLKEQFARLYACTADLAHELADQV